MTNVLNLFDDSSRVKLIFIIHTLFPEYNYVSIKRNGQITLKRRWFSLSKTKVFVYDFIMNDVLLRVHTHVEQQLSHDCDFNQLLKTIVSCNRDTIGVIDKIYFFIKYIDFLKKIHHINIPKIQISSSIYQLLSQSEQIKPYDTTDLEKLVVQFTNKLVIKRLPE